MADITIDGSISTSTARGMRSVVFTSASVGYWFYIETGSGAFVYNKTTDGGATWGAAVTVKSAATQVANDVWFDQWTPGDTGTKIHLWYFDVTNDDVFYRSLDTATDTLGTERTVFNGATSVAGRGCFVSGTKTRSGVLYCAYDIDAGAEKGFHKSTDAGVTWSASLSATFIEATIDQCKLFPATGTGDNDDCWALYQDASTDDLTVKTWDSSAGTASESAGVTNKLPENTTDLVGQYGFDGAIRHSDGALVIVYADDFDVSPFSGLNCTVWDGSSLTDKTILIPLSDDFYYPQIFIPNTGSSPDDLYVVYNGKKDGSQTLGTATTVNYQKSTDGGTTWGAETAYMQGAATAVVQVWTPPMGPRFYAGWRVGTTLIGNAVNSLTFSSGGAVTVLPGAGAATLTGFAPSIGLPKTVSPNVGAASLVGFAPTIGLPKTVAPGVGSASLTGFAPSIGLPKTVAPDVGSATLTGFAPTISTTAAGTTVQPDVGAATLTGFAPAIGLPVTVIPVVGQVAFEGFAPTIDTGAVVVEEPARIGAGSGGRGGLELYVSMRAAEAKRRGESKPITSLVAAPEPLVVVPPVVPRVVRQVEPVELGPREKQSSITELQSALPVEAPDYGPSLLPELAVLEKEPFSDESIDAIRLRREALAERERQIAASRAALFAPRPSEPTRSPVAYAAQLAEANRLAMEDEELAYVLLIAA